MKTKNNVQKKIAKLVTLGFMLVAMSIGGYAQNLGNSFPEVLAMGHNSVETYSAPNDANVYASYFVEVTEEALELEDWMTDENRFDGYSVNLQSEMEEALEIEEWMIDESTFNHLSFQCIEEKEAELEVEEWMISDKIWNR